MQIGVQLNFCLFSRRQILRKGGKAVDAIIGAMLCDGLTLPQSMGIGGGFFMVIYDRKHQNVSTINARETAPAAATKDMFHSNSTSSQTGWFVFDIIFTLVFDV